MQIRGICSCVVKHVVWGTDKILPKRYLYLVKGWSKNRQLIFASSTLCDWLKYLAPRFYPIRSKPKTNHDSRAHSSHQLHVFTSSFDWFIGLWLTRVISLASVLRLRIENRFYPCVDPLCAWSLSECTCSTYRAWFRYSVEGNRGEMKYIVLVIIFLIEIFLTRSRHRD